MRPPRSRTHAVYKLSNNIEVAEVEQQIQDYIRQEVCGLHRGTLRVWAGCVQQAASRTRQSLRHCLRACPLHVLPVRRPPWQAQRLAQTPAAMRELHDQG
jgi:hypothetical protein